MSFEKDDDVHTEDSTKVPVEHKSMMKSGGVLSEQLIDQPSQMGVHIPLNKREIPNINTGDAVSNVPLPSSSYLNNNSMNIPPFGEHGNSPSVLYSHPLGMNSTMLAGIPLQGGVPPPNYSPVGIDSTGSEADRSGSTAPPTIITNIPAQSTTSGPLTTPSSASTSSTVLNSAIPPPTPSTGASSTPLLSLPALHVTPATAPTTSATTTSAPALVPLTMPATATASTLPAAALPMTVPVPHSVAHTVTLSASTSPACGPVPVAPSVQLTDPENQIHKQEIDGKTVFFIGSGENMVRIERKTRGRPKKVLDAANEPAPKRRKGRPTKAESEAIREEMLRLGKDPDEKKRRKSKGGAGHDGDDARTHAGSNGTSTGAGTGTGSADIHTDKARARSKDEMEHVANNMPSTSGANAAATMLTSPGNAMLPASTAPLTPATALPSLPSAIPGLGPVPSATSTLAARSNAIAGSLSSNIPLRTGLAFGSGFSLTNMAPPAAVTPVNAGNTSARTGTGMSTGTSAGVSGGEVEGEGNKSIVSDSTPMRTTSDTEVSNINTNANTTSTVAAGTNTGAHANGVGVGVGAATAGAMDGVNPMGASATTTASATSPQQQQHHHQHQHQQPLPVSVTSVVGNEAMHAYNMMPASSVLVHQQHPHTHAHTHSHTHMGLPQYASLTQPQGSNGYTNGYNNGQNQAGAGQLPLRMRVHGMSVGNKDNGDFSMMYSQTPPQPQPHSHNVNHNAYVMQGHMLQSQMGTQMGNLAGMGPISMSLPLGNYSVMIAPQHTDMNGTLSANMTSRETENQGNAMMPHQ